jgi:hypothetical protein
MNMALIDCLFDDNNDNNLTIIQKTYLYNFLINTCNKSNIYYCNYFYTFYKLSFNYIHYNYYYYPFILKYYKIFSKSFYSTSFKNYFYKYKHRISDLFFSILFYYKNYFNNYNQLYNFTYNIVKYFYYIAKQIFFLFQFTIFCFIFNIDFKFIIYSFNHCFNYFLFISNHIQTYLHENFSKNIHVIHTVINHIISNIYNSLHSIIFHFNDSYNLSFFNYFNRIDFIIKFSLSFYINPLFFFNKLHPNFIDNDQNTIKFYNNQIINHIPYQFIFFPDNFSQNFISNNLISEISSNIIVQNYNDPNINNVNNITNFNQLLDFIYFFKLKFFNNYNFLYDYSFFNNYFYTTFYNFNYSSFYFINNQLANLPIHINIGNLFFINFKYYSKHFLQNIFLYSYLNHFSLVDINFNDIFKYICYNLFYKFDFNFNEYNLLVLNFIPFLPFTFFNFNLFDFNFNYFSFNCSRNILLTDYFLNFFDKHFRNIIYNNHNHYFFNIFDLIQSSIFYYLIENISLTQLSTFISNSISSITNFISFIINLFYIFCNLFLYKFKSIFLLFINNLNINNIISNKNFIFKLFSYISTNLFFYFAICNTDHIMSSHNSFFINTNISNHIFNHINDPSYNISDKISDNISDNNLIIDSYKKLFYNFDHEFIINNFKIINNIIYKSFRDFVLLSNQFSFFDKTIEQIKLVPGIIFDNKIRNLNISYTIYEPIL